MSSFRHTALFIPLSLFIFFLQLIPGDWRHGADPDQIEAALTEDRTRAIKAVAVVHNETSTGVASRIAEIATPGGAGPGGRGGGR